MHGSIRLTALKAEHVAELPEEVQAVAAQAVDAAADELGAYYAIFEDKCIGFVGLRVTYLPGTLEAFVYVRPECRNMGSGTAAMEGIMRIAFDTLRATAVVAECRQNRPAARICSRLGFVEEPGTTSETAMYSVTQDSWRSKAV